MPNSTFVQGRTYYFSIIVKEMNSDTVTQPFFCTLQVGGEIIETDYSINYTDINYTINWIQDYKASIKFNEDVNMTWLEDNWNDVFKVKWTDTDFRTSQVLQNFSDFDITNFGKDDNRTVNFTMTFFQPYNIGLLNKRSDFLRFNLRKGYEGNEDWYCNLFIGNCTEIRLQANANATVERKMELIFDMRNPVMKVFRVIAANMYYVVIALIFVQFVLLVIRGVGLFPMWILVEYL